MSLQKAFCKEATIALSAIRRTTECQPREAIDTDTVAEYAEALEHGARFPRVIMFFDQSDYWLADGWHRLMAHEQAGRHTIDADVYPGGLREATLYSCGANAEHGLRRSNADKRRAVLTLLEDEEWSSWSDREIAKRAKVSNGFVSKLRRELSVNGTHIGEEKTRTASRGGQVYEIETGNIGRSRVLDSDQDGPNSSSNGEGTGVPQAGVEHSRPQPNEKGLQTSSAPPEETSRFSPTQRDALTYRVINHIEGLAALKVPPDQFLREVCLNAIARERIEKKLDSAYAWLDGLELELREKSHQHRRQKGR